jgi:hypothetical protein
MYKLSPGIWGGTRWYEYSQILVIRLSRRHPYMRSALGRKRIAFCSFPDIFFVISILTYLFMANPCLSATAL